MTNFQQGNMEAAQANFETFLAREPDSGPARFRLSLVHARRGRFLAAIELGRQALHEEPDRVELLAHLARCHIACGQPETARSLATRALSLPREKPIVLDSLGVVMTRLDEQALAMELFDQAIALDAGQSALYFNRGLALKQFGLPEEAERDFEHCLSLDPAHAKAHWALATLRTQDLASNHLQRLRDRLLVKPESPADEEFLALALSKELDDMSDLDGAAHALLRGIASRRGRASASMHGRADRTDTLMSVCGEQFFRHPSPAKDGPAPVFVLGMPRSGVALLGKLLSRHSKIHHLGLQPVFSRLLSHRLGRDSRRAFDAAAFEQSRALDFDELGRFYLAETSSAGGKQLITCESQPMNFELAGFIARALPGARMLNMVRDPLDNCVSILGHAGGESSLPSHDPGELAASYIDQQRLLRHWHHLLPGRIMDVDYESLVEKPEMVLRVICSFLGIRYASSLRTRLQLHQRSLGRGLRYAGVLPGLQSGLQAAAGKPLVA